MRGKPCGPLLETLMTDHSELLCGYGVQSTKIIPNLPVGEVHGQVQKQVHLNEDTLYLNNISYFVDTIGHLSSDLHPERLCEKVNEKCIVFGGMQSEYSKHSNWSTSRITFKERRF